MNYKNRQVLVGGRENEVKSCDSKIYSKMEECKNRNKKNRARDENV